MKDAKPTTWFDKSKTCSLEGLEVSGRNKLGATETGKCTSCWRDGFGTLFARIDTKSGPRDVFASTCKVEEEPKKPSFKPGKMVEYNFAGRRYEGRVVDAGRSTAMVEHADPLTGKKSAVRVPRSHILDG